MRKERLVSFSDGVLAVIITIMVLELRVPSGGDLRALHGDLAVFLAYVLSFVNIAIYWNNHHHLLYACERIDGRVMWANMHLLFWLSLIPFTTAWVGQNAAHAIPTAVYGAVLIMAAIAYWILVGALIRSNGRDSALARAIGSDFKGRVSVVLYAIGIGLAFINQWFADAMYVIVAIIWLVPDPRIERKMTEGR
jgi:uncharacterized membrane protein